MFMMAWCSALLLMSVNCLPLPHYLTSVPSPSFPHLHSLSLIPSPPLPLPHSLASVPSPLFSLFPPHCSHSNQDGLTAARKLCESLIESVKQEFENWKRSQQPLGFGGTAPGYGPREPYLSFCLSRLPWKILAFWFLLL